MNTTIRTFLTVVAADAAVLGALYAWDQHQSAKADKSRAVRPTPPAPAKPMTAAEHAELNRLRRYSSGTVTLPDYFPSRAAYIEAETGYNIDLLDGEAVELASMPVQQLIAEITHSKSNLRQCRRIRFTDYTADSSAVEMWIEHLEALKAEFDFRFEHRQTLSELDRTRLEIASAGVHTHTDEWPPYGLSGTKTTVNAYATKAVEAGAETVEGQE